MKTALWIWLIVVCMVILGCTPSPVCYANGDPIESDVCIQIARNDHTV